MLLAGLDRGFHGVSRAPTILLRAKWLIIIITISYFLRLVETTEKQKEGEININKSSEQRERGREMKPDCFIPQEAADGPFGLLTI